MAHLAWVMCGLDTAITVVPGPPKFSHCSADPDDGPNADFIYIYVYDLRQQPVSSRLAYVMLLPHSERVSHRGTTYYASR